MVPGIYEDNTKLGSKNMTLTPNLSISQQQQKNQLKTGVKLEDVEVEPSTTQRTCGALRGDHSTPFFNP